MIIKENQFKNNYDLYESVYSNLHKYKSIADFRKSKRKKRKKHIENIINNKQNV